MKRKSKSILHEEWISVSKSEAETIRCLQEQTGLCHESFPDGSEYNFVECGKGKFYIQRVGRNRRRPRAEAIYQMYYVYAEVLSKDGETFVKITSEYHPADVAGRVVSAIFSALFLLALLIICILEQKINIIILLIFICSFIVTCVCPLLSADKNQSHQSEVLAKMEEQIKRRAKSIERWDD